MLRFVLALLGGLVVAAVVSRMPGRGGALGVQELRNLHDGAPGEAGRTPLDLRRPRDAAVVVMLVVVVVAVVVAVALS